MHKHHLFFLVLASALLLPACRHRESPKGVPEGFEDFAVFYERFHADSLYQIAHIAFPLQGLPPQVDSATLARNTFVWQREDWTMHRPLNPADTEFRRTFIPYTEDLLEERIVHQSGDYGMIRRWSKADGEWYLIYYAAMNKLAARE